MPVEVVGTRKSLFVVKLKPKRNSGASLQSPELSGNVKFTWLCRRQKQQQQQHKLQQNFRISCRAWPTGRSTPVRQNLAGLLQSQRRPLRMSLSQGCSSWPSDASQHYEFKLTSRQPFGGATCRANNLIGFSDKSCTLSAVQATCSPSKTR